MARQLPQPSRRHGLSREALLAAVEEQGQERGLLRPLLFKLPLKVGKPDNPWLTQVYVHQGDVPRELALVGFDDTQFGEASLIPLSSIRGRHEGFGEAIVDLLFNLSAKHGATLILVTHATELAERCDRTIHLRDGRLETQPSETAA